MSDLSSENPAYEGPAIFSYGFRPFFLGAALFAGVVVPVWYGWITWREPLVLILHFGYGWYALSLLVLGGSIIGIGLPIEDAMHAFTTGAVGG